MIITFCLILFYAPLDWGGRHMRAATIVHLLVLILFLFAIFYRKSVWLEFDGDIIARLGKDLSEKKISSLIPLIGKRNALGGSFCVFSEQKLIKKLSDLKFSEGEIATVLKHARRVDAHKSFTPYLAPYLLLFICWAFMSTVFSTCLRASFEELIRLTDYIILSWIISAFLDKKIAGPVIGTIIFSGITVSFLGIFFLLLPGVTTDFRAYSTFYQSDAFAGYLLLITPLSMCLSLVEGSFWRRVFLMVSSVIFFSSLLLTQSRGAWLCIIVVLVLLLIALRKQNFKVALLKIAFFVICSFLFVHFFPTPHEAAPTENIKERFESISDISQSSVVARFQFWVGAFRIAFENPFLGIGLGNFGRVYPVFQQNVRYFSHYTHNYYAQIAAETGIVGFIFLMIIVFIILFHGTRLILKGEQKEKSDYLISLGLFSSILASMMHSFIDVDWNFPAIPHLFWIETGIFFIFISEYLPGKRFVLFKDFKVFPIIIKFVIGIFLFFFFFIFYAFWQGELNESKARAYMEEGQTNIALACLNDALAWDPLNSAYYRGRGRIMFAYFNQNRKKIEYLDFAIRDLEEAVFQDHCKAAYHSDLGKYYLEKYYEGYDGFLTKAREQYELAVKYDPMNYPQFYTMLAQIAIIEGNEEKAENYYLKGANILENLNELNYLWDFRIETLREQLIGANLGLADLYLTQKKFDLSRKYYQRALSLDEKQFNAYYGLAISFMSEGDLAKAEIYLLDAVEIEKNNPDFYYLLGIIKSSDGKNKKAKEYLEKTLEIDENYVSALIELGRIYKKENKFDLSKDLWNRALKLEPDNELLKELMKE